MSDNLAKRCKDLRSIAEETLCCKNGSNVCHRMFNSKYSSCLFLNSCALGWKKVSLSATALQTSWTSRCGGKIHLRLPISSLRIFSLQENVSVYTLFLHASKLPVEWINIKHNPLLRLSCRDPWKILKMLQQASRAGSPVGSSKHCFPTKMRRLNA